VGVASAGHHRGVRHETPPLTATPFTAPMIGSSHPATASMMSAPATADSVAPAPRPSSPSVFQVEAGAERASAAGQDDDLGAAVRRDRGKRVCRWDPSWFFERGMIGRPSTW